MATLRKAILLSIFMFPYYSFGLIDVDFYHSTGIDLMHQYSINYESVDSNSKIDLLKKNYEKLNPRKLKFSVNPIIPKIIHFIWIGPNPIPQNYKYYIETWKKNHPKWNVIIWDDQKIHNENLENINLYFKARSYQERSDIARYEILKKYGGLYVDTDIECLSSFDELNHKYDFYANLESPAIKNSEVSIVNSMIGSIPNHPIIVNTIKLIKKNWDKSEENFENYAVKTNDKFKRSNHYLAVNRTMKPFSDAIFNFLENNKNNFSIVLPSGYNVPSYYKNDRPIRNFFYRIFAPKKIKLSAINQIRAETMSIHFYRKENSLMQFSSFGQNLFSGNYIAGGLYKFLNAKDKYFFAFNNLFKKNFPDKVQYNNQALIPLTIYLRKSVIYKKNVKNWQIKNGDFLIKSVSDEDLLKFIPKNMQDINSEVKILVAQFYFLQRYGGVFINSDLSPIDLKEFHYKYGFYGKFDNLNSIFDNLYLDLSLMAASPNHSILNNTIAELERSYFISKNLNLKLIKDIYIEFVYRYLDLDGKNIVFPEIILEQKS